MNNYYLLLINNNYYLLFIYVICIDDIKEGYKKKLTVLYLIMLLQP